MAPAASGLLSIKKWFVHICATVDDALKAASLMTVPPHFAGRASRVVGRCASVAGVIPLSSYFRKHGLKRIAHASFVTRAAWTAMAQEQGIRACSPSVRLALRTSMANPVADFAASASDSVGVQAFFGVQL